MCQEAVKAGASAVAKEALVKLHAILVAKSAEQDEQDEDGGPADSVQPHLREGTVLRVRSRRGLHLGLASSVHTNMRLLLVPAPPGPDNVHSGRCCQGRQQ